MYIEADLNLFFQGVDKMVIEVVERSRVDNGTPDGQPLPSGICLGGHVILPKNASVPSVLKRALEKEAVKLLNEHNIPL